MRGLAHVRRGFVRLGRSRGGAIQGARGRARLGPGDDERELALGAARGEALDRLVDRAPEHLFVHLGQFARHGDPAIAPCLPDGRERLEHPMGRFVDDEGVRDRAMSVERAPALGRGGR